MSAYGGYPNPYSQFGNGPLPNFPGSYAPDYGQFQASVGRGSGQTGPWANFQQLSLNEKRELFFGAPNNRQSMAAQEDMFAAENRTRPFAWRGQNMKIQTTLIRRIGTNEDFVIRRVLPMQDLPVGNKIEVTQLEFNNHLLDNIPEQGVGRLTTSSFKMWEYTTKRKGLAFMMEDGFAMTDLGISSYAASIQQISNATIDTMVLDAYFKLLTVAGAAADYYQLFGITHSNPSRLDIFNYEKELWSILSKKEYGFWHMVDKGNKVFAARRITPDTLILPNGTRGYLKRNRPETIDYSRIGPAGPANFLSSRNFIQTFDGLAIYEASLYDMAESELPEDPMVRDRQIGEFGDSLHSDHASVHPREYTSALRSRTIHDNLSDAWATLSLKELFDASGLFEKDKEGHRLPSMDVGRPFFAGAESIGQFCQQYGMLDTVVRHLALNGDPTAALTAAYSQLRAPSAATLATGGGGSMRGSAMADGDAAAFDAASLSSFGVGNATGGRRRATPNVRTVSSSSGDVQLWDFKDHSDLKQYNTQASLEGLLGSLTQNNSPASYVFKDFKERNADPARRSFTGIQLKLLDQELSKAYESGDYDTVKVQPWVQFLRLYFASKDKQREMYGTLNADAHVGQSLLRSLYGADARAAPSTGSAWDRTVLMNEKDGANWNNSVDESEAPDPMELHRMMNMYRHKYPQFDRLAPSFLPGAYKILRMTKTTSNDARRLMDRFIVPVAEFIVAYTDFETWEVGKQLKYFDAAGKKTTVFADAISAMGTADDYAAKKKAAQVMTWFLQNKLTTPNAIVGFAMFMGGTNAKKKPLSPYTTEGRTIMAAFIEGSADTGGIYKASKGPSGEAGAAYDLLFQLPITGHFFDYCISNNIPFPIDFLFVRPHMNYEMGSAILCKSGLETGASFFGDADFQLSNEGNRKVLLGFFTCYTGAVVYKPNNVHILHNIICKRYKSGGGVRLFDNLNQHQRMAYHEGRTEERDIFVIPLYPGEKIHDIAFDLTGYFPDQLESGTVSSGEAHYKAHGIMKAVWGWMFRQNYFDIEYFSRNWNAYNTVAMRMHQFMPGMKNGSIEEKMYYKQGQGHWGKDVYPGVRADREGNGNGYVRETDWSMRGCLAKN